MLTDISRMRVFLKLGVTDMRKSINTLGPLVEGTMNLPPMAENLYVFCNRRKDIIKILYWDRDGCAIWHKRLAEGAFEFPKVIGSAASVDITATDLALILGGVALNAKRRMRYTRPPTAAG